MACETVRGRAVPRCATHLLVMAFFLSSQKRAVITPALKKPALHPTDIGDYRPIFNLSFISKLLERCAHEQFNVYLQQHGLIPEQQSAYRRQLSTETAMLKVLYVYVASDAGHVTRLGLLDFSVVFDTVDHWILIERLRRNFGVMGHPLDWVIYLNGRKQYVRFNGTTSGITSVSCGVQQGSVLGPALFVLYTADVILLIEDCGFLWTIMLTMCRSTSLWTEHSPPNFWRGWLTALRALKAGRFCLNPSKTELIWLGSPRRRQP